MYQANVYNIMIGGPSDVQKEVEIAKQKVHEWNDAHSHNRKIVLLPLHWQSNTYADFGEYAQGVVNDQITDKSDVLIAIFGAKLGSPTNEHESGTVEEIQEHILDGKTVMLFFRRKNQNPNSEEELQQQAKLLKFKNKISSKCIFKEFEDTPEFEQIITKQLELMSNDKLHQFDVNETFNTHIVASPTFTAEEKEWFKAWAEANYPYAIFLHHLNGLLVRIGKFTIEAETGREQATIESFFEKMESLGFTTKEFTDSGEPRFKLTQKAYEYFDSCQ